MEKPQETEPNEVTPALTDQPAVGLDIGTSRLVMATSGHQQNAPDGQAAERHRREHIMAELNAFISIPFSKFTENILNQNQVSYQKDSGKSLQIYGNEAEQFANFFNTELHRPMLDGVLNPGEEYSLPMLQAMLNRLLPKPSKNEKLCFSVPGPLRTGQSTDLVYHETMLQNLLCAMGFDAKPINEGLAVVLSELEATSFTGIGISCGGGMCNVALAYLSIPVLTFSIAKAGDYIDHSVASVTGELPTRVRAIKEEGLDLSRAPRNRYESALHVYYDELITSLVTNLRDALAESHSRPRANSAMPIVLSGGTAKPKGVLKKFRDVLERTEFPLEISEIRMAESPLTATARGCLVAAQADV